MNEDFKSGFLGRWFYRARLFCVRHPLIVAFGATLLLVAFLLLRASQMRYQYFFGMYHDDGLYLVSARSLAENLGYKILSLPGEPLQSKYPIGYPFFLSILLRLTPYFPDNLLGFETVQQILSVSAIFVMIAYLLNTRKITYALAMVIASACLLNLRFIDFSPMLMSDMPSALFIAICMWSAEKQSRRGDHFSPWVGVLLALAMTVRTQTVVLLPALLVYWAVRRRIKLVISTLLVLAASVAPQIWWQSNANHNSPEILTYYVNYLKHGYTTLPPSSQGFAAQHANFSMAVLQLINTYLPGLEQIPYKQLPPLVFFLIYDIGYYLLCIPGLIGLAVKIRYASLPALYLMFYALSLMVWPSRLEWRHVLPVMVLGYYFYFVGFRYLSFLIKAKFIAPVRGGLTLTPISAQTDPRRRLAYSNFCKSVAVAFGVYLIAGSAILSGGKAGWLNCLSVPPKPTTVVDLEQAFNWIKSNTSKDAVIVCNNDPVLYLRTGRRAIMPSRLELWRFLDDKYVDPQSLVAAINYSNASYIMNEPAFRMRGFAYTQLAQSIVELDKQRPGFITPVYITANGLVTIYKINKI